MDDSVGGVNDPDGICKTIRVGGRNDIHIQHEKVDGAMDLNLIAISN